VEWPRVDVSPGTATIGGRLPRAAGVYGRAVVTVLPAWIIARVCVAVALIVAHNVVSTVRPNNPAAQLRVHQGLLAWDGGWYQSIAGHGYVASSLQSVRFFPAYPMAARALAWIPGIGIGPALVVIANLSALAAMAALVVLVDHEVPDQALGRRSGWLLGLAPSAYCLVLGYADGSLLLCSIVTFLAARTGRWWWAATAGLIAGLVRPVGILLFIPVLVEVVRARSSATTPMGWAGRLAAIAAPVIGTGIYLGWVDRQFGDGLLPFRVQQQLGHRGGLTFPLVAMWHNATSVFHGHHLGSASHIPWVIVAVILLVVAFRRLPVSYGLFASAALAVSLTSSNLDSFERYALGAFPLIIAASTFTASRRVEVLVLIVTSLGMVGYVTLAFLGVVVP
jgi:hypothetical protein